MDVKVYKYNDKTQLTEHYKVSEFKCKCGKNHDIKIDSELPKLLEKVMVKIGAKHGYIYSGYRCSSHDKNVGGSGRGPHTLGYAVDMYFVDSNNKKIPSSKVAIALEEMNHQCGIGYRCGKSSNASGNTHIDTKNRKWWGDESVNSTSSIWQIKKGCYSYYDYLGIKKEVKSIVNNVERDSNKKQIEVLINDLYVRDNPNGKSLGFINKGLYNVLDEKIDGDYLWIKVDENKWIARNDKWNKIYEIEKEIIIDEINNNDDIQDNKNSKLSFWQKLILFLKKIFFE